MTTIHTHHQYIDGHITPPPYGVNKGTHDKPKFVWVFPEPQKMESSSYTSIHRKKMQVRRS